MESASKAQDAHPFNPRRAPKSRNGCLRCKAKRLKCDEAKPGCQNCSRKQYPCPGYKSKTLTWSTKHEVLLPQPNTTTASPPSPRSMVTESTFSAGFTPFIAGNSVEVNNVEEDPQSAVVEGNPPSPTESHHTENAIQSRRDSNQFTDSLSAIRQQLNRSTVPEFLLHLPTMLVEYYFGYVCQIFSSFDGTLNPFRSTVGRLWDGSAPIYYAIQSMAAAYLANHFPRMSPVGLQMQRETYKALYQVQPGTRSEDIDKTLLTVLLVGQTTAWHDPNDLGLVHLRTAKRLNRKRLQQQGGNGDARTNRQNEFFEQCILYWDMLGGFVDDDVDDFGFQNSNDIHRIEEVIDQEPPTSEESNAKVFPHPWTGVAPKAQRLFAQVGRLIRKYRKITAQEAASLDFLSADLGFGQDFPQEFSASLDATIKAQSLEEELLAFKTPSISSLVDAGDENTPVQQYIHLAESYQCAALLEIYRIFPSILLKRLPGNANTESPSPNYNQAAANHRFFETLSLPVNSSSSSSDFLVSLALHTISLLEKLPPSSGTRCLQPIVIIAAGSELRFSPPLQSQPHQHQHQHQHPQTTFEFFDPFLDFSLPPPPPPLPTPYIDATFNSLSSRELDIASARRFVTTRLQEFQLSLPAKPIAKALALVQETWSRMDMGQEVFWMDVMDQCGWNTIFG